MKANVKEKKKKQHVKFGDKAMNMLFSQIIDTLIARYHKSAEKETMSFEEYCLFLRDLSNKAVGKVVDNSLDEDDEYNQKFLEEGEKET